MGVRIVNALVAFIGLINSVLVAAIRYAGNVSLGLTRRLDAPVGVTPGDMGDSSVQASRDSCPLNLHMLPSSDSLRRNEAALPRPLPGQSVAEELCRLLRSCPDWESLIDIHTTSSIVEGEIFQGGRLSGLERGDVLWEPLHEMVVPDGNLQLFVVNLALESLPASSHLHLYVATDFITPLGAPVSVSSPHATARRGRTPRLANACH